MTMTDTLSDYDALKEAGVEEPQARVFAKLLSRQHENAATVQDLNALGDKLSAKIETESQAMRRQIVFVGGAAGLAAVGALATIAQLLPF